MNSQNNASPGRHTRRWFPYVGAVFLMALIVAGLWPKPLPVESAPAVTGSLRSTVNEEGKTRIRQRYRVCAPVAGQLRRIPFKAGADVTAGQSVVAVIEPVSPVLLDARTLSAAQARRDSAAANLEKAAAARDFAVSEMRRYEKLYSEKTVSAQEFDAARLRESSAVKDTTAAESVLRQAEAELAQFAVAGTAGPAADAAVQEIKAPATGRVLRVFEENARVVAAGTPLLEIGDPLDLEVVVEVLSRDGAAIAPNTRVELDQWGGTEPLEARVRLVEPAAFTKVSALGVEEQRVNVVADILTPPELRRSVGDSFRVEARIIVWEAENTLKVPAGAVFRRNEDWMVFVISEGRARLRHVTAGRSSGTETQITDGLKAGEKVILYPGSRIADGVRVREIVL